MTEIRHIAEGFMIMVICIIIGAVMSFVMGATIDQMYDSFIDVGVFDVSDGWDSPSQQTTMINIAYYWYMVIPVIGIVIFIGTIVHAYVFKHEDYNERYGGL